MARGTLDLMLRPNMDRSPMANRSESRYLIELFPIVACVICLLISPGRGVCEPYHARVSSVENSLNINGQTALTVPGSAGRNRAEAAAKILIETHSKLVEIHEITRRKYSLATPGGSLVLLVTRADSRAVGDTSAGLAESWAARINTLLSIPALSIDLKVRPLVVPTGGFRSFNVGGAAIPENIKATDDTASVTTANYFPGSRTVTVEGVHPGFATVTITAQDSQGGVTQQDISVLVEDRAGNIASDADATVTGAPASIELLVQAVRSAVYRSVTLSQNAYLELVQPPVITDSLGQGTEETVPVTVRAAGPDLIPVEQTVRVRVVNDSRYQPQTAQALFYSNNPETVKKPQSLFDAYLPGVGSPVRLVLHHQNVSQAPMLMRVEIINRSQTSSMVRIIRGVGGAVAEPVDAGMRAGTQFLREWQNDSSELLPIPAQTRLELLTLKTEPNDVASGIFEIAQINGDPHSLLLHVDAEPVDQSYQTGMDTLTKISEPDKAALALLPLSSSFNSNIASVVSSDQIYATPSIAFAGSYTVGGPWLHLVIGTDRPLARLEGGGSALSGNYGVIYDVSITLSNPTTVKKQIVVTFAADAGDASGIFMVSGQQTATVNDLVAPDEQQIALETLLPGATKVIVIQTLPLSGSAYPAAINAHAL